MTEYIVNTLVFLLCFQPTISGTDFLQTFRDLREWFKLDPRQRRRNGGNQFYRTRKKQTAEMGPIMLFATRFGLYNFVLALKKITSKGLEGRRARELLYSCVKKNVAIVFHDLSKDLWPSAAIEALRITPQGVAAKPPAIANTISAAPIGGQRRQSNRLNGRSEHTRSLRAKKMLVNWMRTGRV